MQTPNRLPDAGGIGAPMLSIHGYRTVDDGRICVYVSLGTEDKPEMPRKFLWEDTETEAAAASIMAIVASWAHRHTLNQPLPFD